MLITCVKAHKTKRGRKPSRKEESRLRIVYGKPCRPNMQVAFDRIQRKLVFLVKRKAWRKINGKWITLEKYDIFSEWIEGDLVYRPAGPVEAVIEPVYEKETLLIRDLEGRVVQEIQVLKIVGVKGYE